MDTSPQVPCSHSYVERLIEQRLSLEPKAPVYAPKAGGELSYQSHGIVNVVNETNGLINTTIYEQRTSNLNDDFKTESRGEAHRRFKVENNDTRKEFKKNCEFILPDRFVTKENLTSDSSLSLKTEVKVENEEFNYIALPVKHRCDADAGCNTKSGEQLCLAKPDHLERSKESQPKSSRVFNVEHASISESFTCEVCKKSTTNDVSRLVFVTKGKEGKMMRLCIDCKTRKLYLTFHTGVKRGGRKSQTNTSPTFNTTSLSRSKPVMCEVCHIRDPDNVSLVFVRKVNAGKMMFVCVKCQINKLRIDRQRTKSQWDKPVYYMCDKCPTEFFNGLLHLKRHHMIHMDKNLHSCKSDTNCGSTVS